jgi:hypothetical protein
MAFEPSQMHRNVRGTREDFALGAKSVTDLLGRERRGNEDVAQSSDESRFGELEWSGHRARC